MKWITCFCLVLCFAVNVSGADGFREFDFGDDYETLRNKSRGLCRISALQNDTRWPWISRADCRNYRFGGSAQARLIFFLSEEELAQVYVISKDIENYFLIRPNELNYLIPKNPRDSRSKTMNLADRLLFKDKVHQLGDEYRYTNFYYNGNWEWEYFYELKGFAEDEKRRRRRQLEEEMEGGVEGWSKFRFDESETEIKEKLEGMCTEIKVTSGTGGEELINCFGYEFLDRTIQVRFFFPGWRVGENRVEAGTGVLQQTAPVVETEIWNALL